MAAVGCLGSALAARRTQPARAWITGHAFAIFAFRRCPDARPSGLPWVERESYRECLAMIRVAGGSKGSVVPAAATPWGLSAEVASTPRLPAISASQRPNIWYFTAGRGITAIGSNNPAARAMPGRGAGAMGSTGSGAMSAAVVVKRVGRRWSFDARNGAQVLVDGT